MRLAEEGPLTYTKLMRKIGIEDSGTFGFHIRRMQKLLKKTEAGKYELNELGLKAYDILRNLSKGNKELKVEHVGPKDLETLVIDRRVMFELTEELLRSFLKAGKRISLMNIIKLTIHPMPRALFDEAVEAITSCLVVYVPDDLADLVYSKAREVMFIRSYRDKPSRRARILLEEDIIGAVPELVANIMDATTSIISNFVRLSTEAISSTAFKREKELVIDEGIKVPPGSELYLRTCGGCLRSSRGIGSG